MEGASKMVKKKQVVTKQRADEDGFIIFEDGEQEVEVTSSVQVGSFPVTKVIMYKNGMAYIEREDEVDAGTSKVSLSFPEQAMSDIIKSINITGQGAIKSHSHSISYEVPPPGIMNSAQNGNHYADIMNKLIGQPVTVITKSEGQTKAGILISVDQDAREPFLSILESRSICSYNFSDIQSVGLANNAVSSLKSLDVTIVATKKQKITLSYIRTFPVWKATYRAVLESGGQPHLYGLAAVHNSGPEIWENVSMSVVTGQPVSFANNIYVPRYKKRPKYTHAKDALGVAALVAHGVETDEEEVRKRSRSPPRNRPNRKRDLSRSRSRSPDTDCSRSDGPDLSGMSIQPGATSTSSVEAVDLFRYNINMPINLASGASMLVPLLDVKLPGKKVALFNNQLHDSHPFSSLTFVNNSSLTLEEGPLTVFEAGMYVGETVLRSTKPRERRFLPFAVELGILVSKAPNVYSSQKAHFMTIYRGSVTLTSHKVTTHTYLITNKTNAGLEIILEHPKGDSANEKLLVTKCQIEDSANESVDLTTEYVTGLVYGLNFRLKPKSVTRLEVQSQREEQSTLPLRNAASILEHVDAGDSSEQIQQCLQWTKSLESERATLKALKEEQRTLEATQTRVRNNIQALNGLTNEQKRTQVDKYLNLLSETDTQLEDLIAEINAKQEEINSPDSTKLINDLAFDGAIKHKE